MCAEFSNKLLENLFGSKIYQVSELSKSCVFSETFGKFIWEYISLSYLLNFPKVTFQSSFFISAYSPG